MKRVIPVLLLLLAVGCTDSVDKAAKKRIFSPEDPPKAVASANEALAADKVADDPVLERRILEMGEDEATERLGPHSEAAEITFEWTALNAAPVTLTETRTLEAAAGGVEGDFHATVENTRDQGLEVIRHAGMVYARSRYMPFRERRRDRGMAERERGRIGGSLREVAAIFNHRLALTGAGEQSFEGRRAYRYVVTLADKAPFADPEGVELPAQVDAKGGVDATTQRRRHFNAARQPTELHGDVWVDVQTGVVLQAKLDGKLKVPAVKEQPEADLHLTLNEALHHIGQDVRVDAPKDFLPDEDKPEGIADALDRFGIQREGKRQDAAASDDQPDDGP